MLKAVAKVYTALIIIILFCEQCNSLEIHFEHEDDNDLQNGDDLFDPEKLHYAATFYEEPVTELPKKSGEDLLKLFFGDNLYRDVKYVENNDVEDILLNEVDNEDSVVKRRLIRQVYPEPATLYPKLPPNSPYNHQPYPGYNNQNPQWRPSNNYSQSEYPSSYGQQPFNPNQPQYPYNNAGQQPNNGQYPYNNNVSSYPGVGTRNSTVYNPGSRSPYNQSGQFNPYNSYNPSQIPYSPTTPPNRHPVIYDNNTNRPGQHNSSHHTNSPRPPYNTPNGQNPQYSNNPYGRPNSSNPYNVPTQGPYQTPSNGQYPSASDRPGQYPSYNNGQNPPNYNNPYGRPNSSNPYNVPTQGPYQTPSNGQYPSASGRPGQYPYNNGQNPQTYNNPYPYNGPNQGPYQTPSNGLGSALGRPGTGSGQPYGQNPYQNPSNGQYPSNNGYPSNTHGTDTFNPASGYNPSIPNKPPYGSPPGSTGTAHDPTRVAPEYFSYPH